MGRMWMLDCQSSVDGVVDENWTVFIHFVANSTVRCADQAALKLPASFLVCLVEILKNDLEKKKSSLNYY